jgi:hypothetical protein
LEKQRVHSEKVVTGRYQVKTETIVKMLMMTMPDELAPTVIMTLANVAVQLAKGEIPIDEIPHDKWELALAVIQAIAKQEMMDKLSKIKAKEAITKAQQS